MAHGLLRCGTHVGSSSFTRDQTRAPCIGSTESYPLCHQGSPSTLALVWPHPSLHHEESSGPKGHACTEPVPQLLDHSLVTQDSRIPCLNSAGPAGILSLVHPPENRAAHYAQVWTPLGPSVAKELFERGVDRAWLMGWKSTHLWVKTLAVWDGLGGEMRTGSRGRKAGGPALPKVHYGIPQNLRSLNSILFIYLFIFKAVLGLRFCARAFSSCGKWGPLFIAVRGPHAIAASPVAEHRLQTRRLSNCGSRAQLLRGMWDLPRPGLEPVSPALAGRLSTTAPPGKPSIPS